MVILADRLYIDNKRLLEVLKRFLVLTQAAIHPPEVHQSRGDVHVILAVEHLDLNFEAFIVLC